MVKRFNNHQSFDVFFNYLSLKFFSVLLTFLPKLKKKYYAYIQNAAKIELITKKLFFKHFINKKSRRPTPAFYIQFKNYYSTVTDLAKFLGWSTLHPLITAI